MPKRLIHAAATVLLSLAVAGCDGNPAAPVVVRPVLSVVVAPTSSENMAIVGTVQPQIKTDFSFRTMGRMIARPVNVGDMLEKGQVLAAIEPAALELAVRSAAAELSNSQARLASASGTQDRQQKLLETDATPKASVETAEQARAAAQSAVVRAQANLTKAREQLGYAQLIANYGGVVTAVSAEIGQVVSPGQPVVTVARPDIREAVIDVADSVADTLRIGMPFVVRLQLEPSISAKGKVREIAPQADPVTRSRRVRIALEDPPEAFRLGTTITTSIADQSARSIKLPASAILKKNATTHVWVVDPSTSTVKLRQVELGASDDGEPSVLGGLEPGARVVTAGVHNLAEGQKVRIEKEGTP